MPAATAALHTLNARLVKAKHELHTSTLKVDAIRSECDRAQHKVEENDAAIASMEREEERLKLAYVEGKLTYEKAHAEKYTLQQELKQLRAQRQAMVKDRDGVAGALAMRQTDWSRCQRRHRKLDQSAEAIGVKLEAVERDKEFQLQRLREHRTEIAHHMEAFTELKGEIQLVHATASGVLTLR